MVWILKSFYFGRKDRIYLSCRDISQIIQRKPSTICKIANVLRKRDDFKFYIAGDGPEKESIMKEIEKYGLQQNVKMLGNISEPHRFIGNMDALLLLSFREVFPMVVIEAMATGTPIISIDVGGINEAVINGESGVLIHEYCESEFASALEELQGMKKR